MAGLGEVLERAIDCEREIRRRDSVRPKLTGEAFVREALKLAGAKRADADALLKKLDDREARPAAVAALTRCRRHIIGEVLSPNGAATVCSQPHRRVAHLIGDAPERELATMAASPQLLFAAAAVSLLDEPDAFGDAESVEQLSTYGAELGKERERLHAELAEVVTLADLDFDWHGLTTSERDAGLIRASFKIAPNVHLGEGWPGRLVDALLTVRSAAAA